MRRTMAISVALLLTLGAYAGSVAVSLQGLVRAAQSGDAAAVMSRTDLPRLQRSLVDQIVAAYLNRIGQKRAVKARAPYEFGCKVSIATPVTSPKGGQFVLHAKALHGNPFDGHALGPVVADMEKLTGVEARRIHVDKGYRGHNHPHRLRVWISGQVRRVTASIRREMKRRAAVEPVIGHVKAEHRMDRNYLKGRVGDRINAVLAAAGYNFGLLLRWLAELLRAITRAFAETLPAQKIA